MEEAPLSNALERLLDHASERFLVAGYAAATVRDLARESGVTVHSVYKNFRGKSGLLSAAINRRFHDVPEIEPEGALSEFVEGTARVLDQRAVVRALVVEGASAARHDPDARDALADGQREAMSRVLTLYRRWQAEGQIDGDLDPYALLSLLWAAELGYGILEALGIDPGKPDEIARLMGLMVEAAG